ncbi:MAG: transglutaminase-like domain-containing protein, partial [Candidatus Hodarchaeota archaeon]
MSPNGKKVDAILEEDLFEYYRTHSMLSDPGKYSHLYEDIPTSIPKMCAIAQNAIIHLFWADSYGITLKDIEEKGRNPNKELNKRMIEEKLDSLLSILDKPLTEKREPINRVVGNCRDYSLLLVSILRHKGIPARVRSGVARYFFPPPTDFHEDHFVCEYWNATENHWQLVDPQIDSIQRQSINSKVNPHDISTDQFLDAGKAWLKLRTGKVKPRKIGVAGTEWYGEGYLRSKLIQDLACVNKIEVLAWEGWGLCRSKRELKNQE